MSNDNKNQVREALILEITRIRDVSFGLSKLISEAKTTTKKNYFRKKLKKNNEELFNYLILLERLPSSNKMNELVVEQQTETIEV